MRLHETVSELAERLDIPEETVSGACRITLSGRGRAVIEYHRGLLGYEEHRVEVNTGVGRVRVLGSELRLRAMDRETLIVCGKISGVEYE